MPRPRGHATEITAKGCINKTMSSLSLIGCFEQAMCVITVIDVHVHQLGVGNVGKQTEKGREGMKMHIHASL
jgi:hypothetical protein